MMVRRGWGAGVIRKDRSEKIQHLKDGVGVRMGVEDWLEG